MVVAPPTTCSGRGSRRGVAPHLVAGELRPGQTVGGALESNGLTAVQVSVIVKSLKGVYDFRAARPGARFEVEFTREELKRFRFEVSPVEVYVVERTCDKRYTDMEPDSDQDDGRAHRRLKYKAPSTMP